METVLTIVLSETRAYENTWELFKKNVLEALNAELCLCIADNQREIKSNPFYQHAKYVWTYEEPDDWGDAFDFAQQQEGQDGDWRQLLGVKNEWLGGVKGAGAQAGSAGILLFMRWFLKTSLLKSGVLSRYDRFIVTRSDFVHRIPHAPLSLLDPRYIWIPDGENYGGVTDRHLVAHQSDIIATLSITDPILDSAEHLGCEMRTRSSSWNMEKYIKFSFDRMNLTPRVKRFPYTMYAVRSPDGHTRWQKGEYHQELGYCIKYSEEYKSFKLASRLIRRSKDWTPLTMRVLRSRYIRMFLRRTPEWFRVTRRG